MRARDDSTVSWTLRDAGPTTTMGFGPTDGATAGCSFSFSQGSVLHYGSDGGQDHVYPGFSSASCGGGIAGRLDVEGTVPGDPRTWTMGTFSDVVQDGSLKVLYCADATLPAQCVAAFPAGMAMRIDVETAIGGALPSPELVSADYVRLFWARFDTADATEIACSIPCGRFPVTVSASLHLEQSALDYSYDPDASCLVK